MCKRRRKMFPPLHLNPQDLCQVFPYSPFVHLYGLSVCSEVSFAIIFASDFMPHKMKYVEQIQFNGMVYTAHSIFYQLFTIFITFHGHCIPAVHILMQNKTEDIYTSVVQRFASLFLNFLLKLLSVISKKHLEMYSHIFPWNLGIRALVPFYSSYLKENTVLRPRKIIQK